MIGHLRGPLLTLTSQSAVIEAGGVGYEVHIPLSVYTDFGSRGVQSSVALHISSQVVSDKLTLYGFLSVFEKRVFEKLIKVSGVGPSSAMLILSTHRPEEIVTAIVTGDEALVARTPRVGKKTAAKIVLELKDRLGALSSELGPIQASAGGSVKLEVVSALVNLGYKENDAARGTGESLKSLSDNPDFETWFKAALGVLTGRK